MSEFFFSYGLFIAKVGTGLLALVFVVAIVSSGRKREDGPILKVTNLNEKYQSLKSTVLQAILDKKQYKQRLKDAAKEDKKDKKSARSPRPNRNYLFWNLKVIFEHLKSKHCAMKLPQC